MNLKTTLKAYPKLSPSILSNYVTKEELEAKDYVTHSQLSDILKGFVREIENPDPAAIYIRKLVDGELVWAPVHDIPGVIDGVLCYGMTKTTTLDDAQLALLNRMELSYDVKEYMIEYAPTSNGYFWICSTKPVLKVEADNGLTYQVNTIEQDGVLHLTYEGEEFYFFCCRTTKLAAIPGVAYKFKITLEGE